MYKKCLIVERNGLNVWAYGLYVVLHEVLFDML